MRVSKTTNALFAAALMLPSLAFWQQNRDTTHDRDIARREAEAAREEAKLARLAADRSRELNQQLQTLLTCRSRHAQATDVALGAMFLAVTSGSPVDLTEERAALEQALADRRQTSERCGG